MNDYDLPALPYAYNALEPSLDEATLHLHHGKHHQAYRDNFVGVLENYPELMTEKTPEEVIRDLAILPVLETDRVKIRNHGGGFVNHNFFWPLMGPQKKADDALEHEIIATFGSVETFKELFTGIANAHFGAGWTWLVRDKENRLKIYSLPNQDSPLTLGHKPIITLDLWEHAYYLKYQNRRAEYIANWWKMLVSIR